MRVKSWEFSTPPQPMEIMFMAGGLQQLIYNENSHEYFYFA